MKNSIKLLALLFVAVGFTSCMKDNDQPFYDGEAMLKKEAPILKEYVNSTEGLEDAILHSSGIWYTIIEDGLIPEKDEEGENTIQGYFYNINTVGDLEMPRISVKYEGKLVSDGTVFDQRSTEDFIDKDLFSLQGLIAGWKVAFFPKSILDKEGEKVEVDGLTQYGLQPGSKIRIVVPSPYGYGNRAQGSVPADAPLDFTIEVFKVIPPAAPSGGPY